jgi:hypothetical protein
MELGHTAAFAGAAATIVVTSDRASALTIKRKFIFLLLSAVTEPYRQKWINRHIFTIF